MQKLSNINTAAEARAHAQEWQHWASTQSLSYQELADWQDHFVGLAQRFPELREEYEENGII